MAQSLRFFLPLPPGIGSQILIGSLVNLALVLTVHISGTVRAAGIGFLLPVAAFFQGQLPVLPMAPVVGVGNVVFAAIAGGLFWNSRLVWFAPVFKAALLYGGTRLVVQWFDLPDPAASALSLAMGAPQIVTGLAGIILAKAVARRINQ